MTVPVERIMMIAVSVGLGIALLPVMAVPMRVGVPVVPMRVGVVDANLLTVGMDARAHRTDASCDRDDCSQAKNCD